MQLSCDGVAECKSNSVSLDVFSARMINCQQVYPLRICRPIDKSHVDDTNHLELVLQDLLLNDFFVKHFVADNLKRATSKGCLNHAALFPCDYCFARGVRCQIKPKNIENFKKSIKMKLDIVTEKLTQLRNTPGTPQNDIKTLEKISKELTEEEKHGTRQRSHIVWPASTSESEARTDVKILEILRNIERDPTLSREERKGVVSRSPLWDIPGFIFTRDAPCEYMHTVCIGVVKRLLELTFTIGENRSRVTKRKLSSPVDFNLLMSETKVSRESSRRSRKLDFAVMKAQEMRNIVIFYVPHVLQCIESNAKERKVWILLFYMIRSCIVPTKEFQPIDLNHIYKACKQFYILYEQLFGMTNCTYNTHIVSCHLIDMRVHGPLTFTSAFGFEAFYGEMRNSFTPGTQSTLKQIFQKTLLKRALSYHCCENSIFYSERDTPLESNNLIYCFEDLQHEMYKIIKVEKDSLICYKQGKFDYKFKETASLNLNWSQIGVYKKGGVMETITVIPKKKVAGKVIKVGEFLITCPANILREK